MKKHMALFFVLTLAYAAGFIHGHGQNTWVGLLFFYAAIGGGLALIGFFQEN